MDVVDCEQLFQSSKGGNCMGVDNFGFPITVNQLLPILMLYIGPETMLPLASALAAIGGLLLMFWQRFIGLLRWCWRRIVRKGQ